MNRLTLAAPTEHTPTPWMAASKYSSVVGVPIVAQTGKRICNTAFAHHVDDDEAKRLAEANAAFIVKAVNNHDALMTALEKLVALAGPSGKTAAHQWGAAFAIASDALARLALVTVVILAAIVSLAIVPASAQQLAPRWDARPCEHNDNRPQCSNWSPADDAMAKRFQTEPFVAPDTRVRVRAPTTEKVR